MPLLRLALGSEISANDTFLNHVEGLMSSRMLDGTLLNLDGLAHCGS